MEGAIIDEGNVRGKRIWINEGAETEVENGGHGRED